MVTTASSSNETSRKKSLAAEHAASSQNNSWAKEIEALEASFVKNFGESHAAKKSFQKTIDMSKKYLQAPEGEKSKLLEKAQDALESLYDAFHETKLSSNQEAACDALLSNIANILDAENDSNLDFFDSEERSELVEDMLGTIQTILGYMKDAPSGITRRQRFSQKMAQFADTLLKNTNPQQTNPSVQQAKKLLEDLGKTSDPSRQEAIMKQLKEKTSELSEDFEDYDLYDDDDDFFDEYIWSPEFGQLRPIIEDSVDFVRDLMGKSQESSQNTEELAIIETARSLSQELLATLSDLFVMHSSEKEAPLMKQVSHLFSYLSDKISANKALTETDEKKIKKEIDEIFNNYEKVNKNLLKASASSKTIKSEPTQTKRSPR